MYYYYLVNLGSPLSFLPALHPPLPSFLLLHYFRIEINVNYNNNHDNNRHVYKKSR